LYLYLQVTPQAFANDSQKIIEKDQTASPSQPNLAINRFHKVNFKLILPESSGGLCYNEIWRETFFAQPNNSLQDSFNISSLEGCKFT
jgi:hypothetical protein